VLGPASAAGGPGILFEAPFEIPFLAKNGVNSHLTRSMTTATAPDRNILPDRGCGAVVAQDDLAGFAGAAGQNMHVHAGASA
jgi:hypothetical protein